MNLTESDLDDIVDASLLDHDVDRGIAENFTQVDDRELIFDSTGSDREEAEIPEGLEDINDEDTQIDVLDDD